MSDVAAAEQTPAPIRRNGFTNESLEWRSWLQPLDLAKASLLQLEVLDESHPQARTSAYYRTLAHQPLMLRHSLSDREGDLSRCDDRKEHAGLTPSSGDGHRDANHQSCRPPPRRRQPRRHQTELGRLGSTVPQLMDQQRRHLLLTEPSCQKICEDPAGDSNAATAGGVGNGAKVLKHTVYLGFYAIGHLHGYGIQANLAREIHGVLNTYCL